MRKNKRDDITSQNGNLKITISIKYQLFLTKVILYLKINLMEKPKYCSHAPKILIVIVLFRTKSGSNFSL